MFCKTLYNLYPGINYDCRYVNLIPKILDNLNVSSVSIQSDFGDYGKRNVLYPKKINGDPYQ